MKHHIEILNHLKKTLPNHMFLYTQYQGENSTYTYVCKGWIELEVHLDKVKSAFSALGIIFEPNNVAAYGRTENGEKVVHYTVQYSLLEDLWMKL
jgi:hypothetical protein